MIHSMTAFARMQKQSDTGILCWEIRSVNHRYLDASFRLPESLRFLETSLRTSLREGIHRGRIECQLKIEDTNAHNQSMLINKGMIHALVDLSAELASTYQVANDMSLSHLLAWPGVVQSNQLDVAVIAQEALALFQQTVGQLIKGRISEGQALKAHIKEKLSRLEQELTQATSLIPSLAQESQDKLLTRLHMLRMEVPEERVQQELALILARMDVREELDRLQTHCVEVRRLLGGQEEQAGRRLDFLMQELNREANTLSSKSDSTALTQKAVEMKVLIEQMREQIQNIE